MTHLPPALRRPGGSGRLVALVSLLLAATGVAAAGLPVAAQSAGGWWAGAPVSTEGLAAGRWSQMEMLYERTFLRVDVLRLSMRFDEATAARLQRIAADRPHDEALDAEIVDAALAADQVLVRSRFLRDISLDQFLDGIRENLVDAQAAGLLSDPERSEIVAAIEISYEPLRAPGVRAGDTLWYRIRGDAVHIVYQNVDGEHVVDQHVEGSKHRRAVLGGYLSPRSDFRSPLARSLFEDRGY